MKIIKKGIKYLNALKLRLVFNSQIKNMKNVIMSNILCTSTFKCAAINGRNKEINVTKYGKFLIFVNLPNHLQACIQDH